jgi:hypothetical protein
LVFLMWQLFLETVLKVIVQMLSVQKQQASKHTPTFRTWAMARK